MTTNTSFDPPQPDIPLAYGPPSPSGSPYYPPPAPSPRKRGAVAMIVGAVLLVSGFLTAASGGALLALFGNGQQLSTGQYPVSTSTSALVAEMGHIENLNGLDAVTGSPTLHFSAENIDGSAVFIGVGRSEDVARYLDGVAIDRVTDLDVNPLRLNTERHDGTAVATPPAEQTFWVASTESSNRAQLTWALEDGRYQVVFMNADGSAGVLTSAQIGTSLPSSTGLWVAVLSIGVLVMVGGAALMFVGARRDRG